MSIFILYIYIYIYSYIYIYIYIYISECQDIHTVHFIYSQPVGYTAEAFHNIRGN